MKDAILFPVVSVCFIAYIIIWQPPTVVRAVGFVALMFIGQNVYLRREFSRLRDKLQQLEGKLGAAPEHRIADN